MKNNNPLADPSLTPDVENYPRQRRADMPAEMAARRLQDVGVSVRREAELLIADDGENLRILN